MRVTDRREGTNRARIDVRNPNRARGRPVRAPKLRACGRVGRAENGAAADRDEARRRGRPRAGVDVLEQCRLQQEVERVPAQREIARVVEGLDRYGARGRSVAAVEPVALEAAAEGDEVEPVPEAEQVCWARADRAGADIADHARPGARAVTRPQLAAVHTVVGAEVEPSVTAGRVRDARIVGPWIDIPHHARAGGRPVGRPQLAAVRLREGGEEPQAVAAPEAAVDGSAGAGASARGRTRDRHGGPVYIQDDFASGLGGRG